MLGSGVGVHHAGLSDEVRSLIEWLAEEGKLRVLCATTTIAQGINFPVSSVFLSSVSLLSSKYPYRREMGPREFWNLAGRAGRIGQDTVGVIGLARGNAEHKLKQYVSEMAGSLVSRLVRLLDDLQQAGQLQNLKHAIAQDQWRDFRCYVAHLWRDKQNLDAVLADTDGLLRSTFGYSRLRSTQSPADNAKAEALLNATKGYVQELDAHKENAVLADSTGFAPEGVRAALLGLKDMQRNLERNLTPSDWEATSLFGNVQNSSLPNLVGVMLQIEELRGSLNEISSTGLDHKHIAALTADWVNGKSLREIAETYFKSDDTDLTLALTKACRAIYRTLVNSGPWGMSALSKMPTSGLDFETLSADAKQRINALPSMIYHGVRSEAAVLMRMNSVPRSVAEALGAKFQADSLQEQLNVKSAREYLKSLDIPDWADARPEGAAMSGEDYREVWHRLSGES
jgi:replicative superfamily II helicase